jgi:hypothetical protein
MVGRPQTKAGPTLAAQALVSTCVLDRDFVSPASDRRSNKKTEIRTTINGGYTTFHN